MKHTFQYILFVLTLTVFSSKSAAQVICVWCYDQDQPVSTGVTNLIQNGSFENTNCVAGEYFCPNSSFYTGCTISNWTVTGGGIYTYAQMFSSLNSIIPDGNSAVYLGNAFCQMCSETVDDTSCVVPVGCFIPSVTTDAPVNSADFGGSTGVSISQTVSGLTVGNKYFVEFWSGGEGPGFFGTGVFGVDVGFGNYLMTNKETYAGFPGTGIRYLIEFKAVSTSHTIKFTNWGHICSSCTEAVFDDVKMYTFSEVSPSVVLCDQNGTIDPTLPGENPPPPPGEPVDVSLIIPNVLTPDGDGTNDLFTIQYNGKETFDLSIVDRWGALVFKSNTPANAWNGKVGNLPASEGVYYYTLKVGAEVYHGFLTLVK